MPTPFFTTLISSLLVTAGICVPEHWLLSGSFLILAGIAFYVRDAQLEDEHYEIGFNDGKKSRGF